MALKPFSSQMARQASKSPRFNARWNSKSNAYDNNIEKTVYEKNDDNVTLMVASTK